MHYNAVTKKKNTFFKDSIFSNFSGTYCIKKKNGKKTDFI